jgi:hypothetical protein
LTVGLPDALVLATDGTVVLLELVWTDVGLTGTPTAPFDCITAVSPPLDMIRVDVIGLVGSTL